ncbi:unnamed protein product, partial [marine sediment metagenome]
PDKAWKAFERRIAKSLGTERTPLSGGASRHTRSDTLHPDLFVECKQRKTSLLHGLFVPIRRQAKVEHKVPVLAYHRKGSPNTLAVIDWHFFLKLWNMANDWVSEHEGTAPLDELWGKD